MESGDILREMAKAYERKGCPGVPIAVSFDIDGQPDAWHLDVTESVVELEPGGHPNAEFAIVTTTEVLQRLHAGEISPLTAAGRESLRQKTPLDFRLPEGVAFDVALYHRIVLFAQRFFNPSPGERIRMSEERSRVVHGGRVVGLYADAGFRSGWYLLNPGDQLNEPGDTNPFPQAFVILSGSGTAQIGNLTHDLEPSQAYHIPPNTDHVVRPSKDEPLTLIWFAWGEGA